MSPAHDPRLDASGEDHPGVLPGPVDLIAIERTRLGLKLAGAGLALVLIGVVPMVFRLGAAPGAALFAMRFAGWSVLAVALALTAPTPNGPLPDWLRWPWIALWTGGALRVAYHRFAHDPAYDRTEILFVRLLWASFLAFPLILWRFCQLRGLTGRALTWLWCSLALATVFAVNWWTRSSWALWLCPTIGVVLFWNARSTARDLWFDAVYKSARTERLHQRHAPAG